jgi:hypothetical protein
MTYQSCYDALSLMSLATVLLTKSSLTINLHDMHDMHRRPFLDLPMQSKRDTPGWQMCKCRGWKGVDLGILQSDLTRQFFFTNACNGCTLCEFMSAIHGLFLLLHSGGLLSFGERKTARRKLCYQKNGGKKYSSKNPQAIVVLICHFNPHFQRM